MNGPTINTERLVLRALLAQDAPMIMLYVGDWRVAKHLAVVPHPYPEGAAESFIAFANNPETPDIVWAITLDDQQIGAISITPKPGRIASVGYWLAPQLWGGGFMSEALMPVIAYARKMPFKRLVADVHQGNDSSVKVLMKCGFSYIGECETHSIPRGGMVPAWEYALELRDE